jgi:AraC family transcriptional regulator
MRAALNRAPAFESGARIELASRIPGERTLLLLDAARERSVALAPAPIVLCVCVQGRMDLHGACGLVPLLAGEAFVGANEQVVRLALRDSARGVLLLGSAAAWQDAPERDPREPPLFTALHRADPVLEGVAQALLQAGVEAGAALAAQAYARALELDCRHDALVARCPGRSAAQRRQTLARFERTRNRARFAGRPDSDVGMLARQTNYTRWHFVRVFHQIYGLSPAQWLLQLRREACERLLAAPASSIAEVATLAGFSSHAAFSRWFRAAYGMTASEWRLRGAARRC